MMLTITQCNNSKEVELLAQSIAESLEEKGFTESDLITTASVIIDQAIKQIRRGPKDKGVSRAS